MAIAFVSAAEFYAAGISEDHTITLPSFSQDDIIFVHFQQSGNFTENATVEGGFTQLTNWNTTTGSMGGTAIWYRVMQSGDPSTFHITYGAGDGLRIVVNMVCYSGNAINSPIDSFRSPWDNGTSDSPVSEAITTNSTNTMILRVMAADDEDSTEGIVFPTGVTNRTYQQIATPGNGGNLSFGDQGIQAATGSTGTKTWTLDTTNEVWITQTIAIRDIANDVTPISNTLTCLYDLRTSIANTLEGLYDMAGRVSNTLTGLYDMREFVSNTLTGLYDVKEFVSNTLTGLYDLRTSVSSTITGIFDIRVLVSNTLTGLYDMQGRISNTLTGLYDMQGRISNTLTGLYDLRTSVSNTITGVFDIRELVSNTLTGLYNIKEFVSNTLTGRYNILIFVSNTLTGVYDLQGRISNTLTGIYRIYNIYKQTGSKGSKATTGSKGAKATTGGKSAR